MLSLVLGGEFQRLASILGDLDKSAQGPQHINGTGILLCLLGDSDEALLFPTKWLAAWHWGTDFWPNCQKPTPHQRLKVSTSMCWLESHTQSSCSSEVACQRTPELASSTLAPCAFHRCKSVQLKWIRLTRKGLEKHRGMLSGMKHRPARQIRWWVSNDLGKHFPRRTYWPTCA